MRAPKNWSGHHIIKNLVPLQPKAIEMGLMKNEYVMKGIGIILLLVLIGASCDKKESNVAPACLQEATVKDLRSLDGCDFVFELTDGSRLIPERRVYVQAPKQEEDPLYYFHLKDAEKVTISYRDTQLFGVCMAGKIVFITCISPLQTTGQ